MNSTHSIDFFVDDPRSSNPAMSVQLESAAASAFGLKKLMITLLITRSTPTTSGFALGVYVLRIECAPRVRTIIGIPTARAI